MTDKTREDFEAWASEYDLRVEPNYNKLTEADCWAAYQAATQQSAARIASLEAEVLALRKDAERQISDGEFEPSAKLMELADKIDHEQNWRNSGIFQRDHLTQDQQDRVLAGVMLRRYADLMAPESWRLFPPARARAVAHSYRASTLEAVVKMAKKYCRAAIEAERGEG